MILYKIIKNLKHLPLILYRALTTSFYKDVPTAIQLAEPADLLRFLYYRILKRPAVITLRKGIGEREINTVCEHFRQKEDWDMAFPKGSIPLSVEQRLFLRFLQPRLLLT